MAVVGLDHHAPLGSDPERTTQRTGVTQVFVRDPDDVGVALDFAPAGHSSGMADREVRA